MAEPLPPIALPDFYNYVGVFLTFDCELGCSYCLNRFSELAEPGRQLTAAEWARGLNRLTLRPDLPVTLQGGEPTLHPEFGAIVRGVKPELNVDLLTNLEFDLTRFMAEIPPGRMRRDAPYASIRVSFHPERMDAGVLAERVAKLLKAGYSVGVWAVAHPAWGAEIAAAGEICRRAGIDFRVKEFLGEADGAMHGNFSYPEAVAGRVGPKVMCRTSELLISPSGHVHRCHSDLYAGLNPVGHILDPAFNIDTAFMPCDRFGLCNPCDVKLKTNRFQEFGHTSVEVEF